MTDERAGGEPAEFDSGTPIHAGGELVAAGADASTGPAEPIAEAPAESPPVSPLAALTPQPGRVIGRAFDVLGAANGELRGASFYVGLLVLGLATPFAFLAWRATLEPFPLIPPDAAGPWSVAVSIAALGFIVAAVESRAVSVTVIAARLAGRPLDLRSAVQRSRTVFWRLVGGLILVNVPLVVVQSFLQDRTAELFGGPSEPSVLTAAIVAAVAFSPLTYVVTGIVLGDVGPWTAVRRSLRLFGARKRLGLVVALFEFGSQLLTAFALGAGLELVLGGLELVGFAGDDRLGAAVTAGLIGVLLFAGGTLLFTVAAVSVAPQVVAFLGLTHAAPGLDRVGGTGGTFRWLTRPFLATAGIGGLVLFAGLAAFD